MSRTLGIDLASQPANTAACVLEWAPRRVRIVELVERLTDDDLLALVREPLVSRVAIDAPFGWPAPFVQAIHTYTRLGRWPAADREQLLLRETDRQALLTGQQPLSVSADRIAYAAMRCAKLLSQATDGNLDRSGEGRYVEVYPAATLRLWGLDPRRYKGGTPEAQERRAALLQGICEVAPGLQLEPDRRSTLVDSDHALDAFVSALTAVLVELGKVIPIPRTFLDAARSEGWIRLPAPVTQELWAATRPL